MSRRLLALVAGILFMALTAGVASAHPVGEDGTPSCFGERISHGSANWHAHDGHGITPVDRAGLLEETVAFFYTISPPDFQAWLTGFFGDDLAVSVKEQTAFVRAVCAGEVPFPEG